MQDWVTVNIYPFPLCIVRIVKWETRLKARTTGVSISLYMETAFIVYYSGYIVEHFAHWHVIWHSAILEFVFCSSICFLWLACNGTNTLDSAENRVLSEEKKIYFVSSLTILWPLQAIRHVQTVAI